MKKKYCHQPGFTILIRTILVYFILVAGCKKESSGKHWKTLTPMTTARYAFGFVESNNLLYAIGGYNADGLADVEVYNPASDSWQKKTSMPTARGYLAVVSVANKIYAIGGVSGGNLDNITYKNVTEEYDPVTDKWTTKSPFPISGAVNTVLGNQFICASAINDKIYIAAGSAGENVPTFIYDPVTDTWSNIGKPVSKFNNEPYFSATANNSMYVVNANDFLKYMPGNNEWNVLQPFLKTRKGACLAGDGDNIYSIGGYNLIPRSNNNYDVSMSGDVEVYSISGSSWVKTLSLNVKRQSAGAVVYDGNLYVAGGAVKKPGQSDVPLSALEVLPVK